MSQSQLPPDIDRLLWEVAESQDPAAYDDFEKRFPQLVIELGKRIKLVRELRDARDSGDVRKPVPRFDRREPTPVFRLTPALAAMCVFAMIGVGFGAFYITNHFTKVQPPAVVDTDPARLPNGEVKTQPTQSNPGPFTLVPEHPPLTPDPTPTPNDNTPQHLKPINVSFDRTKLQVAMQAVAVSGGFSIEFAPNSPNPEIRMQYQQMNSIDILKDLGQRFGFTAFDQGNHLVLIIPNRDPLAHEQPSPSGTAEDLDNQEAPATPPYNPKKPTLKTDKGAGPG